MLERYAHPIGDEMTKAVQVLAEHTSTTVTAANRVVMNEEPETRNSVVGLDWIGVPNGIRTRVLALKGPRPRPLDDGDSRLELFILARRARRLGWWSAG